MIKRLLVSAISLVVSVTAIASPAKYTVKKGDTISGIASKNSTTWNAIRKLNNLSTDKLKPGLVLLIPQGKSATPQAKTVAKTTPVKPVAKSALTTAAQSFAAVVVTSKAKTSKQAVAKAKPVATTRKYTIKNGDCDWLIARRCDIRIADLKKLNPGVDLTKVRPGQVIAIPAMAGSQPKMASNTNKSSKSKGISGHYAMISKGNVRVRKKPSTNGSVKQTVGEGTPVVLLDRNDGWYFVKFPYGSEGWVRQDCLSPMTPKAKKQLIVARKRKAAAEEHEIRAQRIARRVDREDREERTSKPNRRKTRYSVASSNGGGSRPRRSREADPSWDATNDANVDSILKNASEMRGVRYRYGAASRSGTDCSGFTSQVYKKNGIKLPRTSREQSSVGAKVDRNGLKPGDLVFFKTVRGTRVSHVGIYMGNGKFIHASSGGRKVQVNNLSDGYYNRRFVGARRVVKSKTKSEAPKQQEVKKEEPKAADPTPKPTTGADTVPN